MKKAIVALAPLSLSMLFAPQALFATTGDCNGDKCVAFEVTVKLESFHESPVIRAVEYSHSLGSSLTSFETVVTRVGDSCTKQVVVPRAVYGMITEIMSTMSGGSPVLTPTQQTVLLFYTTLMQQTIGFTCQARDLEAQPVVVGPGGVIIGGTGNNTNGGNLGSGTMSPIATSRVVGVIEMPAGSWSVMVVENGVTRQLQIGDYLIGGWQVLSIGIQQVVVERNGEQRVLIMGSLY